MSECAHYQGVNKRSTAYQLLSKLGWKEGQGLGARKQGIISHVKVRKKADSSGIGVAQEAAKARDWTLGMAAYDRVLASLKVVASTSPERAVDEALNAEKAVGKREQPSSGAQTQKAKRHKQTRGTSDHEAAGQSQDAITQPDPAVGHRGSTEPRQSRSVTHKGRFKKAARGKHVKSYSTNDLAAILGSCNQEGRDAEELSSEAAKPAQGQQHTAENLAPADASVGSGKPPSTEKLWWARHFVSAGAAGSARADIRWRPSEKPEIALNGFSEGDQANLWQTLTDSKTKSCQGLGQSDAPLKVAGGRWSGTKTQISDSDDERPEPSQVAPSEREEPVDHAQATIVPPKRMQSEALLGSDEPRLEPGSLEVGEGLDRRKQMKWRKIAREVLSTAESRSMRLKAFKGRAWAVAAAKGAENRRHSLQEMLGVLSSSRQFSVSKAVIALI